LDDDLNSLQEGIIFIHQKKIKKMKKKQIAVIVPTYNRSRLLGYTLQSIAKQDISRDIFEVVVADDGSSDDTRQVVDKYRDQMNLQYVFQRDRGYCPGSARNKGILKANSEICLFVDSGVLLDKHCLAAHIDFHQQSSTPVASIGYVYGFDQEGADQEKLEAMINTDDPSLSIQEFKKKNFCLDVRESHYQKYQDKIEDLPASWIYFWTCNVSVKRKNLLEVGMFDEQFDGNWGCEDSELAVRLQQEGLKIMLNRQATSIHYPHPKNIAEKAVQGYVNCQLFHKKHNLLATSLILENYIDNLTSASFDVNAMISEELATKER
jgi:glycosyltransferase involved in cell wall biosynthesis